MSRRITKCRICGNEHLTQVLDLGEQMLTGIFPRAKEAQVTTGPLRLVKCDGDGDVCGLLQLEHSYESNELYGLNYGYRSGLNSSMVAHLHAKVSRIQAMAALQAGDLVVDIGSNDGTTLKAYPPDGLTLVGIDPTGVKFSEYYPAHIHLIPEFFTAAALASRFEGRRAKAITSFSMFYDLEDPISFMREVHGSLADDGIWVFEQSYMPTMVAMTSYDTVCQEHLEYYALRQIKWMTDRVGFTIVDVELNQVNGGSFSIAVAKSGAGRSESPMVQRLLDEERELGFNGLAPFEAFAARTAESRRQLLKFIETAHADGKSVAALGASTKGNVLLQYCGLTPKQISFVGEVNTEKFGCYTPGTWIPIISEDELLAKRPDYLLVLPWHFRQFFVGSKKYAGHTLVFPLPTIETVNL